MSDSVLACFHQHATRAECVATVRTEKAMLSGMPSLGSKRAACDVWLRRDTDQYVGCSRLRSLHTLLQRIDNNGFERSDHQLKFHNAFEQACARIIYKEEFPVHRSAICKLNGWDTPNGEVLISTPRRFGKTFAVAQFCACLALASKQEIVIFSPGRRASRSILVRIQEFVQTVGLAANVLEFNQEQLKLQTVDGGYTSSVRSFPSKVSVCAFSPEPTEPTEPTEHTEPHHDTQRHTTTHTVVASQNVDVNAISKASETTTAVSLHSR